MTFYLTENEKSLIKKHYHAYKISSNDQNLEAVFHYNNIIIEVYKDKIVFQGPKEDIVSEYRNYWKIFDDHQSPIIGNSEYGLNNFLGPLVIISCYIGAGNLEKLRLLDISNYQDLSDNKFMELAQDIMKTIIFEAVIINNRKYNQWIDAGYEQNTIKTWGQNQALVRMLQHKIQYDKIILEEYISKKKYYQEIETMTANKNKIIYDKVTFVKNAQKKYLVVTCSIIISRYLFWEEVKKIKLISNKLILNNTEEIKYFLAKIKNEKNTEFHKFLERHTKKNFLDTTKFNTNK